MTTQTDYTSEEWQTLNTAPFAAGMLITVSDMSGPIGMFQEAGAVTKAIIETGTQSASDVVKRIAEAIEETRKPELPDLPKGRDEARAALIDICRRAVEIVNQKAPAETEALRTWLMTIARWTAEAAKEGGFLGFGGTKVSEGETVALNDLDAALGAGPS